MTDFETHSQQLDELKQLIIGDLHNYNVMWNELDDDFNYTFEDIRDLLKDYLKNSRVMCGQEFTCDDCAWPDGTLKSGVGCACGRND